MSGNRTIYTDTYDIIKLKNKYGQLVDRIVSQRGPEEYANLEKMFTEDAVVDMSFSGIYGIYQGHDDIIKFYMETMAPNCYWTWHSFHSPVVDVDGDRASGAWTLYGLALPLIAGLSGSPIPFHNRYDDKFLWTPEGWKHAHLKAVDDRPKP
ncbi:MAG: hypothetical protein JWR50_4385 [Mucilaginibacter sp.]|nr:hypothetical protein [Mucilaginibacter sp.]